MNKAIITLTMDDIAEAVGYYLNQQIFRTDDNSWQVDDYQTFPAKAPREIKYFLKKRVEEKDGKAESGV